MGTTANAPDTANGRFRDPTGGWAAPDGCGKIVDSVGVFVQTSHVPVGFTSMFGTIDLIRTVNGICARAGGADPITDPYNKIIGSRSLKGD